MKAKLEFDLDNPDDKMAHMRCVKATDMAIMLWDIKQKIRSKLKYGEDLSEAEFHQWEVMQDEFYSIASEYGINLDELIQ
jgi:hypothetical protein|tara:strand:+ start:282 stop:521 length:240 start_codon:yes stop_codon:yes gene_type:complete